AVLAPPHRCLVSPAVLGEPRASERVDLGSCTRHGRRPNRGFDLPQGTPAPVAPVGGEALPRHPLLERARSRWALRRVRAARSVCRGGSDFLSAPPLMACSPA